MSELARTLRDNERLIHTLRELRTEAEAERDALRARVAKLEAQNKALHARLEELDNEVRGLRAWHEETTDAETDAEKGEKP